jgi:hypothetical protein
MSEFRVNEDSDYFKSLHDDSKGIVRDCPECVYINDNNEIVVYGPCGEYRLVGHGSRELAISAAESMGFFVSEYRLPEKSDLDKWAAWEAHWYADPTNHEYHSMLLCKANGIVECQVWGDVFYIYACDVRIMKIKTELCCRIWCKRMGLKVSKALVYSLKS